MTTLFDEPARPVRLRLRFGLALLAVAALAIGKDACIHMFCHAEQSSMQGPLPLAEGDLDRDGIPDALEQELARRFAPVVILHRDDLYRPASIDWLVARTDLFHDARPDALLAGAVELVPRASAKRIPAALHPGSSDPNDWVTYVHVYPRADGGINVQYWFFYPFSDGPLFFDHDSDWEHITVQLDANAAPVSIHLAQHENDHPGQVRAWSTFKKEHGHPIVYAAKGTHATYAERTGVAWFEQVAPCDDSLNCEHPVWRTWQGGGLENLGERARPLRFHPALMFQERWGAAGILPGTSAPRGPFFHRGFCVDGVKGCLSEMGTAPELGPQPQR